PPDTDRLFKQSSRGAMIVFTVAYGAPYLQKLFERCLPSLATPNNLPSIKDEPVELNILTDKASWPILQGYLTQGIVERTFGNNVFIFSPIVDEELPLMTPERRNSRFLFHAMDRCIKTNQSFLHAVP